MAKWLPYVSVALSLVTSLFLNQPMHYVPFIVFGTYGAWLYLHYLQKNLRLVSKAIPLVNPIATAFEKIFCVQRSQVLEGQGYVLGNPLPGSDPVEASRGREQGPHALEERLGSVTKAESNILSTENLPAGVTSPSLENEDMV